MGIDRKTVVSGLSSQALITFVMGVLSILSFSLFTRLLTQEIFGYFASLNAILIVFQAFSQAGLGAAVIQKQDCSKEYFSTAFTISILISTLLAVILFFSAKFWANLVSDDTITNPLRLLSILLILGSIESVGRAALMRKLQFSRYGLYQIISYVLSYALGIYLAYKGLGLYSLIVASIMNNLLICLLIFILGVSVPRFSIHKNDAKEIFSFGGWLTASVLVNQLTQQLDKLVLGKWLSVTALGAYSRPSSFIGTIADKINGIFDTVLFPILSSIQDDMEQVRKTYLQSISLLNIFSSVMAAAFFFNAELLIYIFFGKDWLNLVPVFRIISIGVAFMINQRMVDCFFRSLALVKQNFILRVICIVIMTVSLYLGARWGLEATAWCVVIANIISIIIKMIYLSVKIKVNLAQLACAYIKSLKSLMPIVILGSIYLLMFDTLNISNAIAYFVIFCLVIFIEFICFPGFVSDEYKELVRPYVLKIKAKLFS